MTSHNTSSQQFFVDQINNTLLENHRNISNNLSASSSSSTVKTESANRTKLRKKRSVKTDNLDKKLVQLDYTKNLVISETEDSKSACSEDIDDS